MARKSRKRSRRRRTRKRRGGTNLFGKDQNHETPRMRLERMKKNMEKEKQYQAALKSSRSMPVSAKRSAFAKGSKGQATRNVFEKKKNLCHHKINTKLLRKVVWVKLQETF